MTLSLGLDTALSGLSTTADQTAVVSRNVARAKDPNASRKTANLVTLPGGGVKLASITRATDAALLDKMLGATADAAGKKAIVTALDRLDQTINDPELDASPAALVGKLTDALQAYSAAPQDRVAASSAVAAGGNLARALNDASGVVQEVRTQADADIGAAVDSLNTLLARLESVNAEIVKGTHRGADVTDYLDQRDQILAGISQEVGIRTLTRADNDIAVYTDSGVTLFDVRARAVTFARTALYVPSTTGNAVFVDGVPITGSTGSMLASSGRLTGLTAVRDTAAVAYQNQLDEIALGLVEIFAESDQSTTPTLPDAPGLFTYTGAAGVPATGTLVVGLAASIKINASVDPAQGGDATRLRNGGIAGNPAYVYNTTGAAAYTDRLQEFVDGLGAARAFDPAAQTTPAATLAGFAASSVAWLAEARQTAANEADYRTTLLERSSEALSEVTGVNIDEEMTLLLELERSYQASTKLISTIDSMLRALLAAAQ